MENFDVTKHYKFWLDHPETHDIGYSDEDGIVNRLYVRQEGGCSKGCYGCVYPCIGTDDCLSHEHKLIKYIRDNNLHPELWL